MKITTKTTKEQIITALGMNASAVKKVGGELFDRMTYTDKMLKKDPSKVKRADLVSLLKDVISTLGDSFKEPTLQPVAENSVKKPLGKKKTAKKEEQTEESGTEKTAPKKTAKKGSKPTTEKSSGFQKSKERANKLNEVKEYPDVLEIEDDGASYKYKKANDIKTMADLNKILSNEEEAPVVFAFHWNKEQIKAFGYFNSQLPAPKSFPEDLDLATCIYASDNNLVCYAISMYTEAVYCILPEDFEVCEDGARYCAGIDFQIYRQIEE